MFPYIIFRKAQWLIQQLNICYVSGTIIGTEDKVVAKICVVSTFTEVTVYLDSPQRTRGCDIIQLNKIYKRFV